MVELATSVHTTGLDSTDTRDNGGLTGTAARGQSLRERIRLKGKRAREAVQCQEHTKRVRTDTLVQHGFAHPCIDNEGSGSCNYWSSSMGHPELAGKGRRLSVKSEPAALHDG